MKNILILASGSNAKHFIEWVGEKRVAQNIYHVTCYKAGTTPAKLGNNITILDIDPTSFSKLNNIMEKTTYNHIFVVMEDAEDVEYVLKNLTLMQSSIRAIVVNQWEGIDLASFYDNSVIIDAQELVASHLYDHLPNVPLVAQNVGLGKGEIMEILVPFGSTYAYRHVGSILQRKWRISAIYRNDKQILPTNATMIRPNDTLLVVGKPLILDGLYKSINKRIGLFPEPFGKNIYLILDFRYDQKDALRYLKESIYLLERLEEKQLHVRILYPNDFDLIDTLKTYESDKIFISICYDNEEVEKLIEYDIDQYQIGLFFSSMQAFEADDLKETLYSLKKLVYLFGDRSLYTVEKCMVLMSEQEKMESISSTAFDISESLGLKLVLSNFDPEGNFEEKKMIIEHYETLTHIYNMEIDIKQKIANPIRELFQMEAVLQVAPFEKHLQANNWRKLLSTKIEDFLLTRMRHPKLLVPFVLMEN